MKVFISWSGDLSKKIADLLSTWLEDVLQGTKAWLSTADIGKGSIWFDEIAKQLSDTGVGILCVTRNNQNAPWLLFEAGALCKGLPKNRVCPLLVDLQHTELRPGPLSQFHGTLPTEEDILNLVKTVNGAREEQALSEQPLKKAFDLWWPKFEEPFKEILANYKPQKQVPKRPTEEIIEEILELSRSIQRSQQQAQTRRFLFESERIPKSWKQEIDSFKQSLVEEAFHRFMAEEKAETPESETEQDRIHRAAFYRAMAKRKAEMESETKQEGQ